jgi:hypothetical protein
MGNSDLGADKELFLPGKTRAPFVYILKIVEGESSPLVVDTLGNNFDFEIPAASTRSVNPLITSCESAELRIFTSNCIKLESEEAEADLGKLIFDKARPPRFLFSFQPNVKAEACV